MAVTIAVLITYHNEGPLLTECLDSLRRGGSQPDEVLIYDDASDIPPEPYIPAGMPVRVITDERIGDRPVGAMRCSRLRAAHTSISTMRTICLRPPGVNRFVRSSEPGVRRRYSPTLPRFTMDRNRRPAGPI